MKMRLISIVLVIAAVCVVQSIGSVGASDAPNAFDSAMAGPKVKITSTSNTTVNHSTTFTVECSGMGSTKWRDIHVYSARGKKFPKLEGGNGNVSVGVTGSWQTWKVKRKKAGSVLHIGTQTESSAPAGHGNGTFTFTVNWTEDTYDKAGNSPISWKATKNGSTSEPSGSSIINDESGIPPVSIPQANIAMAAENSPITCSINSANDLAASLGEHFASLSYEYYHSESLSDDYTDTLGIGIKSSTKPVPNAWALSFANLTGTLSTSGSVPSVATVTIPSNQTLVGEKFYMVLAVKNSEGQILYSSDPETFEITD